MRIAMMAALLVALLPAGCGDDGGAPERTEAASTTASTEAPDDTTTTAAEVTTTAAAPVTTAGATTTEATTTTTVPADAHPAWGVSWTAFLPPDGATAVYEVETFDGRSLELPARIEYGIEWRDGTWDRFLVGTLEIGEDGAAAYFDLSEPWMIRFGGVENTTSSSGFLQSEYFTEPLEFDFNLLPGEVLSHQSEIYGEYEGWEGTMGFEVDVSFVSESEELEVPAGTYDAAHFLMEVGGEFIGGIMESDVWMDLEDFYVKWTNPPGFLDLELAESWER
jgi:hypothetical protein